MEEQQKTFYDKKNAVITNFKQHVTSIVLIVAIIAFAFKDIFVMGSNKPDPLVLTISMGITYLFTVYVCLTMYKFGKKNGKENSSFKASVTRLSTNKKIISEQGISYLLPAYCKLKTKQKLDEIKRNIIEMSTLNYELYRKGYYKSHDDDLTQEQKKAIMEADRLKITPLTSEELLSESSDLKNIKDPFKFGRKEKEFEKKTNLKLFISKAIIPLIFSPITVSIVFSTNILYSIFQTTIILLCSLSYMTTAEEYVLGELKGRYIVKADYLEDFLALYKSDMNLFKEQEEELRGFLQEKSTIQSSISE